MVLLSLLMLTLQTWPLCPVRVRISAPVSQIPDFDGVVITARNNGFAIVADADAIDRAIVSCESEGFVRRVSLDSRL